MLGIAPISPQVQPDLELKCLGPGGSRLTQQLAALGVSVPHAQPHRPETVGSTCAAGPHLPEPASTWVNGDDAEV